MPKIAHRTTDLILGRGLITAETIYQEIRERLVHAMSDIAGFAPLDQLIKVARDILAEAEPMFSDHLTNTELAAWLAGYHYTSTEFPTWLNREFALINEGPPKPPGSGKLIWPWPDDEPTVRFPLIEQAAESLLRRGILTREQFDAASDVVKQQSFTVAGTQSKRQSCDHNHVKPSFVSMRNEDVTQVSWTRLCLVLERKFEAGWRLIP